MVIQISLSKMVLKPVCSPKWGFQGGRVGWAPVLYVCLTSQLHWFLRPSDSSNVSRMYFPAIPFYALLAPAWPCYLLLQTFPPCGKESTGFIFVIVTNLVPALTKRKSLFPYTHTDTPPSGWPCSGDGRAPWANLEESHDCGAYKTPNPRPSKIF